MPTHYERYCNGECEAVYRELIALGGAVRQEPLLSDAKAVAEETVRRSRYNLTLIYERLLQLGFEFADPENAFRLATSEAPHKLDEIERGMGTLPLLVRTWYLTFDSVDFIQTHRHILRVRKDAPPQQSDV